MKKTTTFFIAILAIFLSSATSSKAQIYANSVISSDGVTNPENAADANASTYAVLQTPVGILNFSQITLGFSQYGIGGMTAVVDIQTNGGVLDANVLQSLSITLYSSKGNIVGQKAGSDFSDVNIVNGTARLKIFLKSKNFAYNIASIKIQLNGLLSAINSIRLYNVYLKIPCERVYGDDVYASHNVVNAPNAVSVSKTDYALLTPPFLADNSYLDISFSDPGSAGRGVNFRLGEGNAILNLDLLENISITIYDLSENAVITKSDFTLADAEVLGGGKFNLNIKTPDGNYQIGRARITFTSLISLLTTLKVYYVSHNLDGRPKQPGIVVNGSTTFCKGDSVKLRAKSAGTSFQWYKNGNEIDGATSNIYFAKKTGSYSVVLTDGDCSSNPSEAVDVTVNDCVKESFAGAKLYPNPFSSYTTLNISGALKGNLHIIISDKAGNLIEEHETTSGSSIRLLQRASPGVYFIKIISGNLTERHTVMKM